MARTFNGNTANKLTRTDTLGISGFPFTLACWFNPDNVTANTQLMGFGRSDSNSYYFGLWADGATAGDPVQAVGLELSGAVRSTASDAFVANTWQHAAGVFTASVVQSWLDGATNGSETNTEGWSGQDRWGIGLLERQTPAIPFSGKIAWPCVWNVALTTAEILAMANGAHPILIRPANIVAFWPMTGASTGDEPSLVGAYPVTESGTVGTDESPLVSIGGAQVVNFTPAAGGGTTIPIFHRHYANMRAA